MTAGKPQSAAGIGIIAVVGAVVVLGCLVSAGFLFGLGFGFTRMASRPVTSEVKQHLKAAYTAERAYFQEFDRYSESGTAIGFVPEAGNRYAYFLGDGGVIDVDRVKFPGAPALVVLRAAVPPEVTPGVQGTCPASCSSTVAAVGQLDGDATLDVWSIGTSERYFGAEAVAAGVPYNHVNDVEK